MDYRLHLYTKTREFFDISILFTDTDGQQNTLNLYKNKQYDYRRHGYQLILSSPIQFNEENLLKIVDEIKRSVPKIFIVVPNLVDISTIVLEKSISECYEAFGENVLYSVYNYNHIRNIIDFGDTKHIKQFEHNDNVISVDPDQEVVRLSNIRVKDIFPSAHCIQKNWLSNNNNNIHLTFNTLNHLHFEHTILVVGDNYVSLSPHVGYIEERDNLVIWLVSEYILVPNLFEREPSFDPEEKFMTEINTEILLERFQEVVKELGFVSVSVIPNKTMYTFESRTLVFIGDFPGDVVSRGIHRNYLLYKRNEPTN